MDALSGRLARYRVTHAPYAVGETLAWLPPVRDRLLGASERAESYTRADIDDLWRDLAAVDSLGMEDQDPGDWDDSSIVSSSSVEAALRRHPTSTFLIPEEAEFLADVDDEREGDQIADVVNLATERNRRR